MAFCLIKVNIYFAVGYSNYSIEGVNIARNYREQQETQTSNQSLQQKEDIKE